MDIDRSIESLFLQGYDAEFIAFCRDVESRHPVSPDFSSDASRWAEFLDCAMIVFSGHKSDTYKDFSMMAMAMKLQEIASNRWLNMPPEEEAAAAVIAGRAAEALKVNGMVLQDPGQVYLVIGLYVYATVASSSIYDAYAFRRLFVLAWFKYYSQLS